VRLRPTSSPLHDETIVVRLPEPRDADALVRLGDDEDVRETIWVPIPTPCSRADAEARIAEFRRSWQEENDFGPTFIVADAGTDEMIGIVFLRVRERDSVELSCGVAAGRRNTGVATAAVSLVASWCLEDQRAAQVELRIGPPNLASQRVAEKAGFSRAGSVRSHIAATGEDYDDLLFTLH
jgi:ribosomal-protein-alanine N-acetyltransferase